MYKHKDKQELLGLLEWINCFNRTAKLFNQELTTAKEEFNKNCELKFSETSDGLKKSFRIDLEDDFGNIIWTMQKGVEFDTQEAYDKFAEEHLTNLINSLLMLHLIHGELGEKMRSVKHKDGTQTKGGIITIEY